MKKHKCFYFQRLTEIFKKPKWTKLRTEVKNCLSCSKRLKKWEEFLIEFGMPKKDVVELPFD